MADSLVKRSRQASRSGLYRISAEEQLGEFLTHWSYSGCTDHHAVELEEVRRTHVAI